MSDQEQKIEIAGGSAGLPQDAVRGVAESGLTRGEFLKLAGAAGLGLAGMGALLGAGPANAGEQPAGGKSKYLFVITHGGTQSSRALLPLILADTVQKRELGEVHIWLVLEGAELCRKGHAEKMVAPQLHKFGNAQALMERIHRNGGKFGVCPPCAEWVGAVGENRHEWVVNRGADWIMENIRDAYVVWL